MAKWFTVTIDTEGDRACPFFVRRWGPLTGKFDSVIEGIPQLRAIWNDFSVRPVYLATDGVLSCPDCIEVSSGNSRRAPRSARTCTSATTSPATCLTNVRISNNLPICMSGLRNAALLLQSRPLRHER